MEQLYGLTLSVEQLEAFAASCPFSKDALLLTEQLPQQLVNNEQERFNLLQFDFYRKQSLVVTTSGRIFEKERELRWEQWDGLVHVTYMGPLQDAQHLSAFPLGTPVALNQWQKKETSYYLFGERIDDGDLKKLHAEPGDLAVLRIPRLLHYPVTDSKVPYVCLLVDEYLEHGQIVYYHFCALERYPPAESKQEK